MSGPLMRAQRGAALLIAMIIVTLVATLAAAMTWRQYRAVQIESGERARAQAGWILIGALDWARLILREDAASNLSKTNWDHLGEVWAVPLAEARLSTFLAAAGGATAPDDNGGPDAFLSGNIEDAQSRYNLYHLLGGKQVPVAERNTLVRLCATIGAPSSTADAIISQLRAAYASTPQSDAPLPPKDADQLVWLGVEPQVEARLAPFVMLLPTPTPVVTPVNLNTAPAEVIAALFDGVDLGAAQRLVQGRRNAPLASPQDASRYFPQGVKISGERASVNSSYFIVTGRLRLDEHVFVQRSLVQRSNLDMIVLERRRVNEVVTNEAGA